MKKADERVPRWPYVLLRGTTTAVAVLAAAQAVLAGGFLSGYYGALTAHLMVGISLVALAVLQVPVAVFQYRAGGSRPVLRECLTLPLVLAVQAGLGMLHILILHIPFGVLMIVGSFRFAVGAWRTPLPARAGSGGPGEPVEPVEPVEPAGPVEAAGVLS
ncbi:hypothetical protein GCM10023322_77890 [Rugosimonospora acidiphila]|uniref:Uncharacterized protein n=1 Tax=Rugosimonospora acidiphila TaxID=556531 RepID=A0ABP9SPM3_9ACTN